MPPLAHSGVRQTPQGRPKAQSTARLDRGSCPPARGRSFLHPWLTVRAAPVPSAPPSAPPSEPVGSDKRFVRGAPRVARLAQGVTRGARTVSGLLTGQSQRVPARLGEGGEDLQTLNQGRAGVYSRFLLS